MSFADMARFAIVGVAILGAIGLGAGAYLGAFTKVEIVEQPVGPFHYVYQEMRGTDQAVLGEITTRIHTALMSAHVAGARPLDVFNPPNGSAANQVGFVTPEPLSAEQLAALGPAIKTRIIPVQRSMLARFPWRHPLSFIVGYLRVDPLLRRHRQEHGYNDAPAYLLNEGPTIAYFQPIVE